jgi:hypothetical protein
MSDYKQIFDAVTSDPRYQRNLDWGEAHPGHPEATVRTHIAEVDGNLEALRHKLSETDYWRPRVLIHTHDTFKGEAQPGVPISARNSHASLARGFLADFCTNSDMLAMVQYHDERFGREKTGSRLKPETVRGILSAPSNPPADRLDAALFALLISAALRGSEIACRARRHKSLNVARKYARNAVQLKRASSKNRALASRSPK